ncbi:hypothetical protein Droror1_Dr00024512 [Drosera rotundifolia]
MMENFFMSYDGGGEIELPPGFRFHPTDEELITYYLSNKVLNSNFFARAIGEVDLNKVEPWDLPKEAKMGTKEWYFFCQKDKKYPTGQRTNRATMAGYWKATGKDKEIYKGKVFIGMKKTLVFYIGRAPRGEKSNWIMHEYRLSSRFSNFNAPKDPKSEWVLCRIFKKNSGAKEQSLEKAISFPLVDEFKTYPLPPLIDSSDKTASLVDTSGRVSCFANNLIANDSNYNFYNNASSSSASMLEPDMTYLQYPGLMMSTQESQDQSILKLLLEGNGSSLANRSSVAEVSMETGLSGDVNGDMSTAVSYNELLQSPFEDRGSLSTGIGDGIDVEALLDY